MRAAERLEFFRRLAERDPEPRTELRYRSPFELLVAVVLSAQSTDRAVNRVTERLFAEAPTPEAMLALGEEGLARRIASLGLYRSKARHLIATCKILLSRHGGELPRDPSALEALPGVGRKTARVLRNTLFGEPVVAVDTHVFRVANRTGLARGRTVREVEERLERRVPEPYRRHAHHWLVLHGRYVCRARRPACERCPVADLCAHRRRQLAARGSGSRGAS
ncbi:MAG: endonuclease III [Xanthomonadales bacterium]|nr:endonuclease III [Xanthomonadales bacterium]